MIFGLRARIIISPSGTHDHVPICAPPIRNQQLCRLVLACTVVQINVSKPEPYPDHLACPEMILEIQEISEMQSMLLLIGH